MFGLIKTLLQEKLHYQESFKINAWTATLGNKSLENALLGLWYVICMMVFLLILIDNAGGSLNYIK